MDPFAERAVVDRGFDINSYWLLFDFRSGALKRIGWRSDFGLFLKEDILGRADGMGPDTRKESR